MMKKCVALFLALMMVLSLTTAVAESDADALDYDVLMDWGEGFIARALAAEAPLKDPTEEAAYTEDGYQDDSLTIRMETREEDGVIWRIGYVQIKDASQLRTGIAGSKATSNRSTYISAMAKEYQAVLAINGDYFADQETKKTYEIRMGETRKAKTNKKKAGSVRLFESIVKVQE